MTDTNRAAFEAYFSESRKSKGAGRTPTFERFPDDTYKDDHTQRHWWTWQQALAAPAQHAAPEQTSGSSAAAPVVGPSLTVGAVLGEDQIEKAWRLGFRHACDAERLNADEEWGYKGANVIEEVQALNSEPVPAQPAAQAEPVAPTDREATADEVAVYRSISAGYFKDAAQGARLTNEQIMAIWDAHIVPVFGKNGISPIVFACRLPAQAPAAQGAHGPNDFNAAMLAQSASVTAQYTRAAQAPAASNDAADAAAFRKLCAVAAVSIRRDGGSTVYPPGHADELRAAMAAATDQ